MSMEEQPDVHSSSSPTAPTSLHTRLLADAQAQVTAMGINTAPARNRARSQSSEPDYTLPAGDIDNPSQYDSAVAVAVDVGTRVARKAVDSGNAEGHEAVQQAAALTVVALSPALELPTHAQSATEVTSEAHAHLLLWADFWCVWRIVLCLPTAGCGLLTLPVAQPRPCLARRN